MGRKPLRVPNRRGKEEGGTGDHQEMSTGQGMQGFTRGICAQASDQWRIIERFLKLLLCIITLVFKMITLATLWKIRMERDKIGYGRPIKRQGVESFCYR